MIWQTAYPLAWGAICMDEQGAQPPLFEVRVEPLGMALKVRAGAPLLTTLRAAGLVLPSSCRNGTCRTCICRMTSGQVSYRIEWPGLSFEEKREGFILPCVAYPASDLVIVHAGARRRGHET